jgi:hypothetical protein
MAVLFTFIIVILNYVFTYKITLYFIFEDERFKIYLIIIRNFLLFFYSNFIYTQLLNDKH